MKDQILLIAVIALAVLTLILMVLYVIQITKVNQLKKRLDRFMTGKNAYNLERDIVGLVEDTKILKNTMENQKKELHAVSKKMAHTYQKMGLIKYDAFKQMGGQLSFCLALLDENNDGFIINSVHSTEGCYTYTKEIRKGSSSIDLGAEEQEVLAIAMGDQNN